MGDPFFDLGNFSINHELTPDDDALLLARTRAADHGTAPGAADAHARRLRLPRGDVGRPPAGRSARSTSTSSRTPAEHFDRLLANASTPAFERALARDSTRRLHTSYASMMEHARAVIIGGGVGGHVDRLPPGGARLARHRARRAGRADERLDVPQRRAGRPAARVGDADPDDDVRLRPVPAARRRDRRRTRPGTRSARSGWRRRRSGWRSSSARPAGRRPSGCRWSSIDAQEAQDRFPLMSTDGVLGGVWLPTDGWLDPSGLAQALAAGARQRGGDHPDADTGRRHRRRAGARHRRDRRAQGRALGHRDRRRRQRRRHVRARDRADGRRDRADHPDGAPVPVHRAARGRDPGPAAAARPGQPRVLPRGGRRAVHGRLRARPGAVGARRHPARLQRQAAGARHAALRADHGGRHPPRARDGGGAASAG